jgi:hypothetical protein
MAMCCARGFESMTIPSSDGASGTLMTPAPAFSAVVFDQ